MQTNSLLREAAIIRIRQMCRKFYLNKNFDLQNLGLMKLVCTRFGDVIEHLKINNFYYEDEPEGIRDRIMAEQISFCTRLKSLTLMGFYILPDLTNTIEHLNLSVCTIRYKFYDLIMSLPNLKYLKIYDTHFGQRTISNIKSSNTELETLDILHAEDPEIILFLSAIHLYCPNLREISVFINNRFGMPAIAQSVGQLKNLIKINIDLDGASPNQLLRTLNNNMILVKNLSFYANTTVETLNLLQSQTLLEDLHIDISGINSGIQHELHSLSRYLKNLKYLGIYLSDEFGFEDLLVVVRRFASVTHLRTYDSHNLFIRDEEYMEIVDVLKMQNRKLKIDIYHREELVFVSDYLIKENIDYLEIIN